MPHSAQQKKQITDLQFSEIQKYKLQDTEIQITDIQKFKLQKYIYTNDTNTKIQI